MTATLHTFFAAEQGSGSTWAREAASDGTSYVHMAAGDGDRYRGGTKAGLYLCPLDECGASLKVSAGAIYRHHWKHLVAPVPAHSPESLWHQAAKAAIAAWASSRRAYAEVLVDTRFTPAGSKPDVWVRDGTLDVAFEVQISALEARDLRGRTARYATDSITPVWLFGHRQPPRLPDMGEQPDLPTSVRLTQEHREASEFGPLRWLNPDLREVATAYVEETMRADAYLGQQWSSSDVPVITYVRRPTTIDRAVLVQINPLDDCTLDAGGMHTPADAWIDARIAEARALTEEALEAENHRRAARTRPKPSTSTPTQAPFTPSPRTVWPMPGGHEPPVTPSVAPQPTRRQPTRDLEERPCPVCGGTPSRRTEWPHWYRPPKDTLYVLQCSMCDTVLGSVRP